MKIFEILEVAGVGRIDKNNQTTDVGPDNVNTQAKKFDNIVDNDGYPPITDPSGKDALEEKKFWDKNPVKKHKKLSAKQKNAAKARAKRAGRSYPNMIDNAWSASR
jgi:hypothetical protein